MEYLNMWRSAVCLITCTLVVRCAAAQDPNAITRDVMFTRARVERVDLSTRSLVLETDQGVQHTVYVGRELRVFDELRPGDRVRVRVHESVVVAAARPGGRPTAISDTTAAARKERGSESDVQQQLKATVTIESVDAQRQIVVYKTGDNRSVTRSAVDPHLLDGLKKGDVVELTYTRERAIELEKQP
jgi:nitrite reductase/ring-hydroxylating ferredoxin subunit